MDQLNGMQVIASRLRCHRSWRVVRSNAPSSFIKTPKPDANLLKSFQKWQRPATSGLRQNGNRLLREESVTGGLAHCFAPIRQLAFKGTRAGFALLQKVFHARKLAAHILPGDRNQIGNAVAIDRNFAGHYDISMHGAAMHVLKVRRVSPGKSDGEAVFCRSHPLAPRKIVARLAELVFRNRRFGRSSTLKHRIIFADIFRIANEFSAKRFLPKFNVDIRKSYSYLNHNKPAPPLNDAHQRGCFTLLAKALTRSGQEAFSSPTNPTSLSTMRNLLGIFLFGHKKLTFININ